MSVRMTIREVVGVPIRALNAAVSVCQSALNYLVEKIKKAVSWVFSLVGISVFRSSKVTVAYDPKAKVRHEEETREVKPADAEVVVLLKSFLDELNKEQ